MTNLGVPHLTLFTKTPWEHVARLHEQCATLKSLIHLTADFFCHKAAKTRRDSENFEVFLCVFVPLWQ